MLRGFLMMTAAAAKVPCRHGLWLAARVNNNKRGRPMAALPLSFLFP